jgi:hypothetical protein
MSAPDFYFAVNAIFRHLHDQYGKEALLGYWQNLGREYYRERICRWKEGGPKAIADDWREFFAEEPQAQVQTSVENGVAILDVKVCPAIKHLRDCGRDIVPYFCEHCDHVCGAMAEAAGYRFERAGGMGSCRQCFHAKNSDKSATGETV